jgi:hypothetical protein
MAYQTGQAADAADLLALIKTFAQANGFTVSGSMVSSSYSFTKLQAVGTTDISVLGYGAANGTTDPGPVTLSLRTPVDAWPATYFLFAHTNPAQLYCIVRYGAERHTWLGFGELQKAYNYVGGNYYSAPYITSQSLHRFAASISEPPGNLSGSSQISRGGNNSTNTAGMFMWSNYVMDAGYVRNTGYFRANYKTVAWPPASRNPCANELIAHLLLQQPNTWNSQTVLLPMRTTLWSSETKAWVDFGCIPHARYARIDNYNSGDIITLGPDRWKVFPFHRKNPDDRNMTKAPILGTPDYDHTGTYGWAIKYDGP